jgi:hypothetical protein
MKIRDAALTLFCVACWFVMPGCGARDPNGKYVSRIHLPSGAEFTETVDFRRNGVCYYGHPPKMVECQWSRQGDTITISRNGVMLDKLQFDGKQLVVPEESAVRTPFVRER